MLYLHQDIVLLLLRYERKTCRTRGTELSPVSFSRTVPSVNAGNKCGKMLTLINGGNKSMNSTSECKQQHWVQFQYKDWLLIGIPIIKIRRSWDRLIFILGNPVLARRRLYIETALVPCNIRAKNTNKTQNKQSKARNKTKCHKNDIWYNTLYIVSFVHAYVSMIFHWHSPYLP